MTLNLEEKSKDETIRYKDLEKIIDQINEQRKYQTDKEHDLEYEREKNAKNQKFFEKNLEDSKKELEAAQKPMNEAKELVATKLDRAKLAEFKQMQEVHNDIKNVFYALMAIFNRPQNWNEVKSYLQELSLDTLVQIDELPVTEKGNMSTIQKYTKDFNIEKLRVKNTMIPNLAQYIIAIEKYFKAKWNAGIKEKNLYDAQKQLEDAQRQLMILEGKLNDIKDMINGYENEKREKEESLEKIKEDTKNIKDKLEKANFLIVAFKEEEIRWNELYKQNNELLDNVLGNTILASAILNYCGVFSAKYREDLLKNHWTTYINRKSIHYSKDFDILEFISNQRELKDWEMADLPNDTTFKENAVIIKYGLTFPLIIDPQDQAYNWIRNMQRKPTEEIREFEGKKLSIFTPQMHNYIKQIRDCLDKSVIIVQNMAETIPMDFDEFITKMLKKEKHLVFFMTKKPNPHFFPEVSARVNIINFLVNEVGLEEQLMGIIMKTEKSELDKDIRSATDKKISLEKNLYNSEETILTSLNNAEDNYLDDDKLIKELKVLTTDTKTNNGLLEKLKTDMIKNLALKDEYRSLAKKISKIFFVLYAMNNINNMYEFSLFRYQDLFTKSILQSKEKVQIESSEDRIKSIEKAHIQRLILFTNQSLFERDRIIFSLQLCLTLIMSSEEEENKRLKAEGGGGKTFKFKTHDNPLGLEEIDKKNAPKQNLNLFNMDEFKLLIAQTSDQGDSKGTHKPNWINDDASWRYINILENKISDFKGITSSFTHNNVDWYKWYTSKDLENEPLPVEWDQKCVGTKNVRRLLFIKALRPDKLSVALKKYITENLGGGVSLRDTVVPINNILLHDINSSIPLMIIHGSGIDPSETIQKIWDGKVKALEEEKGAEKDQSHVQLRVNDKKDEKDEKKEVKLTISTLNQDQLGYTLQEIEDSAKVGGWVYLANTHLTLSSLPFLEKKLDDLKDVNHNFRVVISTNPHKNYPISFLQRCEKITFEASKGIGVNMLRLFDDLLKESPKLDGDRVEKTDPRFTPWCKVVYSLCMFHCILVERRKFKSYGWTTFYDFNNSDFKICFDIIRTYMSKYQNVNDFPWKALQELISINYGSRFTNDKDMKLLNVYAKHFFNPKLIVEKNYNFSSSAELPYTMPEDQFYERFKNSSGSDPLLTGKPEFYLRISYYKDEYKKLPKEDNPELFGLHFNAEISTQIKDNIELIDSIRSLSPELYAMSSTIETKEQVVIRKCHSALERTPELLPLDQAKKNLAAASKIKFEPLLHILVQEVNRYNELIGIIKSDLHLIINALKGNITLNKDIESKINMIYDDRVPLNWLVMYLSLKPLGSFISDLRDRIEFFSKWLEQGAVLSYTLGYFTNPNGFITIIKQRFSLEQKTPLYRVYIEFKVPMEEDETKINAQSGFIIRGLIIEGGAWDKKTSSMKDETIQDLYTPLPLLIMIPRKMEDKEDQGNQPMNVLSALVPAHFKHSFPLYAISIRGTYLGRNSYIMDIDLNLFKDKDKEKDGYDRPKEDFISYWTKKGTCLLLSKND